MLRNRFLIIVCLSVLFCKNLSAQDTIRVFFDFGKSQLTQETKETLQSLSNKSDLNEVDSITFTGYTDSVGRLEANLRLSLKRAKNVAKYLHPILDDDVPFSLYAKGEDAQKTDQFGRRVELVLFYPTVEAEESEESVLLTETDPKCFKIAMYAFSYCNVTEIKKRKHDYARLEAEINPIITETNYYYLRQLRDGSSEAKRVKWKETETGKLWWKRRRLVAEIPLESFERSNFFTLDTGDCSKCNLGKLIDEDTAIRYVERMLSDEFLMSNIKVKKRWLQRSTFKVRVPIEYVDINKTYYSSYDRNFCEFINLKPIDWKRKRGRRKRAYYFADMRTKEGKIPYITTNVVMLECHEKVCNWRPRWGGCGTRGCGNFFRDLVPYAGIQVGSFYQNDSLVGYIGARVSASNENMNYSISVGLNTQAGLFTNASADYKIFYFGERFLGNKGGWIEPSFSSLFLESRQYLYTGTATKLNSQRYQVSFIETNVHLGWGWENYQWVFINRAFIEGGVARDWTGLSNTSYYGFVHAGVRFDFSLKKKALFSSGLLH